MDQDTDWRINLKALDKQRVTLMVIKDGQVLFTSGKHGMEALVELMATNPRRIFHLPVQSDTHIEVDPDARFTIANDDLYTKCGWTPFTHGNFQQPDVFRRGHQRLHP